MPGTYYLGKYHEVLDLLDSGQWERAAAAFKGAAADLSHREFSLLLNAFVRRGVSLVTA